jgi:hypothetical protein
MVLATLVEPGARKVIWVKAQAMLRRTPCPGKLEFNPGLN